MQHFRRRNGHAVFQERDAARAARGAAAHEPDDGGAAAGADSPARRDAARDRRRLRAWSIDAWPARRNGRTSAPAASESDWIPRALAVAVLVAFGLLLLVILLTS